ncbi:MAG: DUF5694 domain-containing protein [Pseudomonadota bacterium]
MKLPASVTVLLALLAGTAFAQESQKELPPAEVLLIGTFHFSNPGHDVVKTDVIDVTSSESQAYLEALSQRIADLDPTAVLLEYDPANQAKRQEEFLAYKAGDFALPVNEIYQLGFRIAKLAGLDSVAAFDEREIGWEAGALFERINASAALKAKVDGLVAQITEDTNRRQATLPLGELLKVHNDAGEDRLNRGFYVMTNDIGAGDDFVGADAAASWWRRNFRMYARIQKHATPGSRVVVIGGQGHTAILRGLLADDPDRVPLDVLQLL